MDSKLSKNEISIPIGCSSSSPLSPIDLSPRPPSYHNINQKIRRDPPTARILHDGISNNLRVVGLLRGKTNH